MALLKGVNLLKKETLLAMHTPQVAFRKFPEEATDFFGYGLGWMVGMHEGHYYVSHGEESMDLFLLRGFCLKKK